MALRSRMQLTVVSSLIVTLCVVALLASSDGYQGGNFNPQSLYFGPIVLLMN